jgi:hypothetical protein
MSVMWTIVLVSLLAVVVAAIGVAGLAGVVRMLRRPSLSSPWSARAGTRWRLVRGNAAHAHGIEREPVEPETRDEGSPR